MTARMMTWMRPVISDNPGDDRSDDHDCGERSGGATDSATMGSLPPPRLGRGFSELRLEGKLHRDTVTP
jgi:hypothetical protein